MRINGKANDPVRLDKVCEIIHRVSDEHYAGNLIPEPSSARQVSSRSINIRVKTRSSRDPGARRGWRGRRMPAACWHAYRDVIRAILTQYPEATARTGMAVYKGREGFEATYPATAYKNIGSMMQPAYMPDLCECPYTPDPTDHTAYLPATPAPPRPRPQAPDPTPDLPDRKYDILERIDATLGALCEDSTGELFYIPDTR